MLTLLGDVSEVGSAGCSSRGPEFRPHYPDVASQQSVFLVPGDPMASSDWWGHQACT